ncbi:MAG: RNA polymerase sigma factor [Ginsengibacter sp.]
MNTCLNTTDQFQQWYETYQCSFMSIGIGLGYQRDEVKDMINQFYLDLIEKKTDPASIQNPKAYLSTAFRRKLIDHYRKSCKIPLTISVNNEDHAEPSKQQILEQLESNTELINNLRSAYRKLPARCRKVIDLKFYQGLTTEEIVLQTGLNKRSVYNNLFEGVKLLRAELNQATPGVQIAALFSYLPCIIALCS